MQTVSLQELLKNASTQTPYSKSLRVKVIAKDSVKHYKNERGEDRNVLNVAVADSTRAVKAVVYDGTKFSKFQEGKTILLRNIIRKPDSLIVTSATKVFPSQDLEISPEIERSGKHLITPPPADVKPLDEALRSPLKTRVSVKGRIVQEDAVHEVTVRNDKVPVRSIFIRDPTTPKAKISLWRDLANQELRPGDYVTITDVVVNSFRNETSFNTTMHSSVQKTDAPEETTMVEAIGVCLEDKTVTFLEENDSIVSVPLEIVEAAIPEAVDIESFLNDMCCPTLTIRCTYKGAEITSIEVE